MFNNILQRTFFNNHISDYIIFILALIIGIVIIKVFRLIVLTRLKKWAKKTDTTIDDFLIHLFEKKYTLSKTLTELEKELGNDFLRIHRSSLINKKYIGEIHKISSRKWVVKLTDKAKTELVSTKTNIRVHKTS